MKQNSNVPAFLTKLWTLVEDSDTNEFICWSQEGNSFLVMDEQRFSKDILPKFFKHNNMASFVRQLNMYGFRKVMHIDTGIVKQERDGPVEFQHHYFKHGQDDLLENIKRKNGPLSCTCIETGEVGKNTQSVHLNSEWRTFPCGFHASQVSNARPNDTKIRQEDLSNILASVQNVHGKQESIDSRLNTLKRDNEGLWREISDLRQKHSQQQQIIKKLIQFIVTLVQKNRMSLKRKRPILLNSNGKKPKYIHEIYDDPPLDHNKPSVSGLKSADLTDDVVICDVTDDDTEITEGPSRALDQSDVEIVEVFNSNTVSQTDSADSIGQTNSLVIEPEETTISTYDSLPTSSTLQLNKQSGLSLEDPMKMMDSILNESGAISQNINLLGKVELMDYLDSIDCSLEDFQAMLYGKQFSIDPDILEATEGSGGPKENAGLLSKGDKSSFSADNQLVQYTSCPLLAFLDGCTPLATEADSSTATELGDSLLQHNTEVPTDLLERDEEPPRSSLIRLEPLTEAEASESTLFYLCELNPEGDTTDSTQLEI
ncbi:heat shock factor protein 2-like isoform X1 [Oncorhynchus kisutch]|uniref:Heat shock transcription factor 2 n=1 Tax=Oncorhynchus kisutch TaxID=8019 RepID=A0A8C7DR73_ONCKI|nr:heat shock factor protein 2-like isoform X1 [Oncorhynchus kisutch]